MWITLDQLVRITEIRLCPDCGLRHARVRTCEETELEHEVLGSQEKHRL